MKMGRPELYGRRTGRKSHPNNSKQELEQTGDRVDKMKRGRPELYGCRHGRKSRER
jgi:hypothetical protein